MSREKNLFNQIKIALDKKTFIQRIENMASSGFPDCIIIIDKLPLFVELKAPLKGNKIKLEKSQVSTHLRIYANNYVSFILLRASSTRDLFLFDGNDVAKSVVLGQEQPSFMFRGTIIDCLQFANSEATKRSLASFSL